MDNREQWPARIGVISDTHGAVDPALFELFEGVQLILHAGDIGGEHVITELETIAPVLAVAGNVDLPDGRGRPLMRLLETPAGHIGLTHGHLPDHSSYQPATLLTLFNTQRPDIIIFGHTHQPLLEQVDGVTLFNPGPAGRAGVGTTGRSVGLITVDQPGSAPRLVHMPLH